MASPRKILVQNRLWPFAIFPTTISELIGGQVSLAITFLLLSVEGPHEALHSLGKHVSLKATVAALVAYVLQMPLHKGLGKENPKRQGKTVQSL